MAEVQLTCFVLYITRTYLIPMTISFAGLGVADDRNDEQTLSCKPVHTCQLVELEMLEIPFHELEVIIAQHPYR